MAKINQIGILSLPPICSTGKNDGSVKGVRYFKCRNRHGIFVRHDKLILDKKRKPSGGKMKNMPSTMRRSTGNLSSSQKDLTEVTKAATTAGSGKPSFMKATSSSSAKRAPP